MRKYLLSLLSVLILSSMYAQDSNWFYATTTSENAQTLQSTHPDQIQIIETTNDLAAVFIDYDASLEIKDYGNLHGPGFIYRTDKQAAIEALNLNPSPNINVLDFDITEDEYVNQCISMVNIENLANTILELEAYGTRFHNQPTGVQASLDIKDNWEEMVNNANRDDVSVEFYNHTFTNQKSIIVSFPGSDSPDEIAVIGGHLDSGDYWSPYDAPGADDNASGIATLTETLRILLANDFKPKKTVQIMAYAAEEIGLYGSADIADHYSSNNKNVLAALQFDMTNYKGSSFDIALNNDPQYISNDLNLFLIELMEHYNASGPHALTYSTTQCGYGCSDHVSWTENGYHAAFPMEAAFNESNPFIHSPNDTFANMGNDASHSAKFVKLALEFVIEVGKSNFLSVQDLNKKKVSVVVHDRNLIYDLSDSGQLKSVDIYDTAARSLISKNELSPKGEISMQSYQNGAYIAVFKDSEGNSYSKKFLLK